jgi:hypothetical protein
MASNPLATARTGRVGLMAAALFMAALLIASGARAQDAQGPAAPQPYTQAELQTLVGPIALYVDDLIGIVLPASAYPLQVVQAARFLDARAQNPSLLPDPAWDDSVVALLNYPEVLRMMDQNLDWTSHLGEAFVYQQGALLDAIQQFRVLAQSAGNLPSNGYQTVAENNGAITIAPANPQVIYVPYYEPARVVTYYSYPAVRYYPYGYPVYDYPYPAGYSFSSGFFWGVTTAFVLNWHTHYVYVYPRSYASHPYYGHRYYDSYYVRHYQPRRYDYRNHHDNVWRPNDRWGPRPVRYDDRRERYTRDTRQVQAPDRRGSSLTPAIASAFANPTRTQSSATHGDDRQRPVADDGNRSNTRGDGYRAPPAGTVKAPTSTASRSMVPRSPLKPPQTAQVTPPARIATTTRPTSSIATARLAGSATAASHQPTAAPRGSATAASHQPTAAPRGSATAASHQPTAAPRNSAPPPRPAPSASANPSRPPKASAAPAPARQPDKQQAVKQGNKSKSEGRGKNKS